MKLLSRDQIESLSKFKSEKFLTTSLYLCTDKSKLTKKEIALSLKNTLSDGRARLETLAMNKEKKESCCQDMDKMNLFFAQSLSSYNLAGIAVFSSSGENFWRIFNLPHPPRNRIVFDLNPYVRPLMTILGRYRQICAFLVERREAKWYEIFMEEISLLEKMTSDVPSKVREGGFEGYESKRIERHVGAHLHDHLKRASQLTFDFFKKNHFDYLFLGCPDEYFRELEPLLHPYLKSRLKGRLKSKIGDSPDKILKECVALQKKLEKEEEEAIVQNLVSELERGGLAVSGLQDTLKSLNSSGVQTLVLTHNFSKEGKVCPSCKFLYVEELVCPSCKKKTETVVDVIDEAIEAAMKKNCQVRHITPPSKLDRYGKIGAFLRYKI